MKKYLLTLFLNLFLFFNLVFTIYSYENQTVNGFNLSFEVTNSNSILDSVYDFQNKNDLPFPVSSTSNQVNYDSLNNNFSFQFTLLNGTILCSSKTCNFNYDDMFLLNNPYISYSYCNSLGGCSPSISIPFILNNGGAGVSGGFKLVSENSQSLGISNYKTIFEYGRNPQLLLPTSTNLISKQITFTTGDSNLYLQIFNSSLGSLCLGSTCSFNYDDSFLINNPILSYSYCNSIGVCSNAQTFPFTVSDGGIGIDSGIYFHGVKDFNGTIIPGPPTSSNNSVSISQLPSLSNISILSSLVLILFYFLF